MPTNCFSTGVTIPLPIVDPCGGVLKSDACSIHAQAIPDLNIPANSTVNAVIEAMKIALISQNLTIQGLQAVLSNPPINNTTATPLTLLQLNTAYPLATIGFKVQCLTILKVYEKSATGWFSYSIIAVI